MDNRVISLGQQDHEKNQPHCIKDIVLEIRVSLKKTKTTRSVCAARNATSVLDHKRINADNL